MYLAQQIILSLTAFALGSAIGSFLSVVIYRVHSGEKGILMGRSHCPKCQYKLQPLDLVPIFSWLFLRGKCRKCKAKISPIYPLLELFGRIMVTCIFTIWHKLINYPPHRTIYTICCHLFLRLSIYRNSRSLFNNWNYSRINNFIYIRNANILQCFNRYISWGSLLPNTISNLKRSLGWRWRYSPWSYDGGSTWMAIKLSCNLRCIFTRNNSSGLLTLYKKSWKKI